MSAASGKNGIVSIIQIHFYIQNPFFSFPVSNLSYTSDFINILDH